MRQASAASRPPGPPGRPGRTIPARTVVPDLARVTLCPTRSGPAAQDLRKRTARVRRASRAAEEAEMNGTPQQEIVVGVSGSRASVAALRWAADEAERRRARLSAICAWDSSLRPAPYAEVSEGPPDAGAPGVQAGRLAAAIRAAFGAAWPTSLRTELAEGMPERVLVTRSAAADLLVLGTARQQDIAGRSVGPVIRTCLVRSRCRSEEHTSELQSHVNLVCRLLLEKKK